MQFYLIIFWELLDTRSLLPLAPEQYSFSGVLFMSAVKAGKFLVQCFCFSGLQMLWLHLDFPCSVLSAKYHDYIFWKWFGSNSANPADTKLNMNIFSFQGIQCRAARFQVLINSGSFCNQVMLISNKMIGVEVVNGNANFFSFFLWHKLTWNPCWYSATWGIMYIRLNSTTFKYFIGPKRQL